MRTQCGHRYVWEECVVALVHSSISSFFVYPRIRSTSCCNKHAPKSPGFCMVKWTFSSRGVLFTQSFSSFPLLASPLLVHGVFAIQPVVGEAELVEDGKKVPTGRALYDQFHWPELGHMTMLNHRSHWEVYFHCVSTRKRRWIWWCTGVCHTPCFPVLFPWGRGNFV